MQKRVKIGDIIEYEKWTGETVYARVVRFEPSIVVMPLKKGPFRLIPLRKIKEAKNVEIRY